MTINTRDVPPTNTARVRDWSFYTMGDAYERQGEVEYVIDPLFARPSLNILYGAPNSLKSFLLADAAVCVASGQRWLKSPSQENDIGFETKQAAVLWLDFDNGNLTTHNRFSALGRAYETAPTAPLNYISLPDPTLNASNANHIDELVGHARRLQAHLIIIDNLGRVSGGLDENSSAMDRVMQGLRRLAENTRAAIVVIHHQRKTQNNAGVRKGETLRGHSSIEAALDLALLVQRKEKDSLVEITATKERNLPVSDFGAMFESQTYENRQGLEKAWFVGTFPEFRGTDAIAANKAIELLSSGRMMRTELKTELRKLPRVGETTVEKVIKALVEQQRICWEQEPGSAHRQWYSLAPR